MKKLQKRCRGFTLIEVLVAVAIFGLLSIAAYTVLDAGMRSQHQTESRLAKLEKLQRAVQSIEKDLQMLSLRRVRNEFGDKIPLLRGQSDSSGQGSSLEFTRADWRNPAGLPRSNLQHLIYSFDQGTLKRLHSIFLDQAPDSPRVERVLLENVQSVKLSFLDNNDRWQESWGMFAGTKDKVPLPRAVRIQIEIQPFGMIERIILVSGSMML